MAGPRVTNTMTFELWDTRSRNAIGGFDSEAAALAVVREAIEDHGRGAVSHWLLGSENADGRSKIIAQGDALADRAQAAEARERHSPVPA